MYKSVCIIGLGYIGLPTAAMFASSNVRVIGVDINAQTVDTINRGQVHIVEPDLDIAVNVAVTNGYLRATTEPEEADAFLIAVPTPFRGDNHEPDLSYIKMAAHAIAPVLRPGNLVVLESTSPVGATEQLAGWLAEARVDLSFPQDAGEKADIRIAYCPERVLPGKVMHELIHNDRLIGGMTPACSRAATLLYQNFVTAECVITDTRTAELAKLTENSFRDVNIAFANELSIICEKLAVDVWELIELANRHPRVNILKPGPGVGGHCIAVDPWFIVAKTPEEARLIRTAREVNDYKPRWVLKRIQQAIAKYLKEHPTFTEGDVTVACYGLAFKPDIDDLRESPAVEIVTQLASKHSGRVIAIEPNIRELPEGLENVLLTEESEARKAAHIHVMLVDHHSFKIQTCPVGEVIDLKGVWGARY